MKYIYDVLLNFNDKVVYDFFEWDSEDDIEYFKKIPLLRVDDKCFKKIKLGSHINDAILLEKIYNAAEIYDNKIVRRVNYACLFSNNREVVAVMLNTNGYIIMISKMLIDEEEEALEIGEGLKEVVLDMELPRTHEIDNIKCMTRSEKHKLFFLNKEIDDLYKNRNINKLKYLYYECFSKTEDNIDTMYHDIKLFLDSDFDFKHHNLYNLIRLSYSKK